MAGGVQIQLHAELREETKKIREWFKRYMELADIREESQGWRERCIQECI